MLATPAEAERWLRACAASVWEMEPDAIPATARFTDYGVGSMQGLLLLERVNRELGLQLKMTLLYDRSSLRELARHLWELRGEVTLPAPEPVRAGEAEAADEAVAVIGLAARLPGAEDAASFWRNLAAGVDAVEPLAPERQGDTPGPWFAGQVKDVDRFDAGFFRLSPREAELMDPQQRLFLEVCWTAFEDAGWPAEALAGRRCGVFAGVMGSDYQSLLQRAGTAPEAQLLLGTDDAVLAARVAYLLNLKGPALTLKTACSSSLVAVHLACRSLLDGESDLALAGGVTLYLDGRPFAMMQQAGMLSPAGRCRPFDDGADGIAVGDGVGVVVLKRLSGALADGDRIYGVIRGSGMNQDGRTNGLTAPSKESQTALELAVFEASGIDPDTISCVEAHGTGTSLGDPIEVAALTEAFRAHTSRRGFCALGSAKGNIGHTTAAAGVAGLVKVLLSLQNDAIPPSLHFERPNRHIDFADSPFFVNTELRPWPRELERPRRAAISAFGYGGTNCHLIVEEPPEAHAPASEPAGLQVVLLSARDEPRLEDYARRLLEWLGPTQADQPSLAEIAFTLQTGRSALAERLAAVAADRADLLDALGAFLDGRPHPGLFRGRVEEDAPEDEALPLTDGPAGRLAEAWVAGRKVDWRSLWGAIPPRRVALPTYPFARERYWIPGTSPTDAAPAGAPVLTCLRPVWRPAPVQAATCAGPLLLLDRSETLAEDLRAAGWEVVLVRPGEENGLGTILQKLAEQGAVSACAVHRGPEGELLPLFELAQALQEAGSARLVWLEIAEQPSPSAAAVAGFARALLRETDRLTCCALTVERVEEVAAALRASLGSRSAALRWRAGALETAGLEAFEPDPAVGLDGFRTGGAYLIAGGAGGLGLILAEELVRRYHARLLLCGRSPLPDERLARLRGLGGEVHYLQADIAVPGETERLVAEAKARFGVLDGVVQAAGLIDDALLAGKPAERIAAVLAPKIAGTLALDRATRDEPLELFLLFSSLAAAAGNAGQTDYAAANGFLDGFAEWRERERAAGRRAGRCLSVAWPLWAEGGMGVTEEQALPLRETLGLVPLPTRLGLSTLFELLAAGAGPRAVVHYGDPARFLATLEGRQRPDDAPAPQPAELREAAEAWFRAFFAEQLRMPVEKLDVRTRFEALGIDSIMINAFNARLGALIGSFPRTVLFDHRTIAELADYFARHHAGQLRPLLAGSGKAAGEPAPGAAPAAARRRSTRAEEARHDIAIIGIAGRYPGAADLESFWENLSAGRDCIGALPLERWRGAEIPEEVYCRAGGFLEEVEHFDPLFFGIAPREAERMDPQERLFLETAWHTLEDAAYPPSRLAALRAERGEEVGVFVGVTGNSYALWGPELWRRGEAAIPEAMPWSIANRVSFLFDLHGPSLPVDTACSASLSAVHLACESLRRGDCALALVGGVNLYLHPAKYAQLCQLKMLSPAGRCRSFGTGADGFVPGEGVGAVLLKPLAAALADGDRIHAVIRGSAVNHGGRTNGYTVPSPRSQAALVEAALADAGVEAASISYLEAHGTGTALGDPVELDGLTQAFGERPTRCALGSVKSNIGHLESAAGIAGLTKIVLQMRHRRLAPTLHAEQPNENLDFARAPFALQLTADDWTPPVGQPRRAGVSSFGAGGANAHVILEEPPEQPSTAAPLAPQLCLLSARGGERLSAIAGRLRRYLEGAGRDLPLEAVAFTLAVGREPLPERLALVAGDLPELCRQLVAVENGEPVGRRGRVKGENDSPPEAEAALARRDLEALAALWAEGARLDWRRLWAGAVPRPVSLPGYPFARRRCWILDEAPEPAGEAPAAKPPAEPDADPLKAMLRQLERGEIDLEAAKQAFRGLRPAASKANGHWNGHG